MPETFPTPEFSEEEEKLIDDLCEGRPGCEERFAAFINARREAIGLEPRPNVELDLSLAKLIYVAGAWRVALEYLMNAKMQAQQEEGMQDLVATADEMRDYIIEAKHLTFDDEPGPDPRFHGGQGSEPGSEPKAGE